MWTGLVLTYAVAEPGPDVVALLADLFGDDAKPYEDRDALHPRHSPRADSRKAAAARRPSTIWAAPQDPRIVSKSAVTEGHADALSEALRGTGHRTGSERQAGGDDAGHDLAQRAQRRPR